ncbi:DUF2259 domain-containing protein [Devosia rhodophyticola]|uniref:DUF2259 domain-containing protein n=1 Tax=Devosia rhodophyticola TaxID=3026423 RepID=A0ABY7Z084_9HYPH|nr:DUF2259 domain-containing protein [Devosia rhodophyticola]WDR06922.1 DUF2259 domain-containing protein [Devosia rhodophyticola]
MILNAAIKVLARRGIRPLRILVVAAALFGVVPALAGDRAQFQALGYSPRANFFAYEEFGIGDGSGFAYSNIYIVDLTRDIWVVGTPIRLEAQNEQIPLEAIRSKNLVAASTQLNDLGLKRPIQMIAMIGDGAVDTQGTHLHFGLPGYVEPGAVNGDFRLDLKSFPATTSAPCKAWFGDDPKGYQLDYYENGATRVLHQDGVLPMSRGCPLAYRIYGVALPFDSSDMDDGIAIVSMFPHGFEGPDRRFLVVPLRKK